MPRIHHRHRARLLPKYDHHCAICPSQIDLDVHHITPQHKGGKTIDENLIILCKMHHDIIKLGIVNVKELKKYQRV